jgi:hypothetical protein
LNRRVVERAVVERTVVTLRAPSSVVIFVAITVAGVVLVADAAIRGRWDVAVASAPAVGLGLWAATVVFLTPGVRLTGRGVTVWNVLRTTFVPWTDVEQVTTRFQMVVTTRGGLRIRCWGAPTAARPKPERRRGHDATGNGSAVSSASALRQVVDSFSERQHPGDGETGVSRRWNWPAVCVGGVLLTGVVVQVALFAALQR